MDQNTNSAFSADFGEMESSEVRILGATDFNNWEETRTVDWIYKVPKNSLGKYRKWKKFFEPRRSSEFESMAVGYWGFGINGAYDGRGRWTNDLLKFVGVSSEKYNYNMNAYNEANLDINFGKYTHTRGLHVKGDPQNINWDTPLKQLL